jgi:hypothetical protein
MTDEQWLRLFEAQALASSSAINGLRSGNGVLVLLLSIAADLTSHLKIEGESMAVEMDRLADEVSQDRDVKASAITLLSNLADRVRAAAGDKTKATELANQLDESSNALAAAIAANTIAEGGGTPETPPGEAQPA